MDSDRIARSNNSQPPHAPAAIASVVDDPTIAALIEDVCAHSQSTMVCAWLADSIGEAVRRIATNPVDVLVLDERRLHGDVAAALAELYAASTDTKSLFIGPQLDTPLAARSIALGLRGHLPMDRLRDDLAKAVAAVVHGQLWFTRAQMAELLGVRASTSGSNDGDSAHHPQPLSARELEVLHHALQGKTNKQIAAALAISEQTIKIHLHNIYGKLGIHRRIELLVGHHSEPPAGTFGE